MKIIAALALGLALGAPAVAIADQPTNEVPTWMRHTCKTDDSVNCYWPGGSVKAKQGESYRRVMPGAKGMVCVFFVNNPKRDYCS
jgi:hypothetical protein